MAWKEIHNAESDSPKTKLYGEIISNSDSYLALYVSKTTQGLLILKIFLAYNDLLLPIKFMMFAERKM